MLRLFRLLDLAARIYQHQPVTLANLTNLRRLADLAQTPPGADRPLTRPVTIDDLRAEYRAQFAMAVGTKVTEADVRELVEIVGAAKAAQARDGGGAVRRADFEAHAAPHRAARKAAEDIRGHLVNAHSQASLDDLAGLVTDVISGRAGGRWLQDVLDLLTEVNPVMLHGILTHDQGRLLARLDMAFVGTGPLLRHYNQLLDRSFRGGRAELAEGLAAPAQASPVPLGTDLGRLADRLLGVPKPSDDQLPPS
jgi:hypothetical protein